MFPQLAVRELVANGLIHQRFVDTPPRSRNEALPDLRGTGQRQGPMPWPIR